LLKLTGAGSSSGAHLGYHHIHAGRILVGMRPRSRPASFIVNMLILGSLMTAVLLGGFLVLLATAPGTSATVTEVQYPGGPHDQYYRVHFTTDSAEVCDGTVFGSPGGIRVGDTVPIRYLRLNPCDNPKGPYGAQSWLPLAIPAAGLLALAAFIYIVWHHPDVLGRLVLGNRRR
jgi:hypothetical protein